MQGGVPVARTRCWCGSGRCAGRRRRPPRSPSSPRPAAHAAGPPAAHRQSPADPRPAGRSTSSARPLSDACSTRRSPATLASARAWPRRPSSQDGDQVHRVAPGVRLLHAAGVGVAGRQAGQHRLGHLPAGQVQRLKGLVGEVSDVPDLHVAVIGGGGKEHVGHLPAIGAGPHGRDDAALGALGVAHLDKVAEPALERRQIGRRPRAGAGPGSAAAVPSRVARHGREAVVEGARPVRRDPGRAAGS